MSSSTATTLDVASTPGGAAASNTNQNSILSAKVSRALEVRSDTPAMKAALDALAHLPNSGQDDLFSSTSGSGGGMDSRSVRVAIEQDALQQALLLEEELRGLLDTVTKLRVGVSETAAIAARVEEAIHMNVMTASVDSHGNLGDAAATISNEEKDSNGDAVGAKTAVSLSGDMQNSDNDMIALHQEQKLASLLSDAFAQRNQARKRVEAVTEFLEKFDLSEEDSRLLDHYAFEDIDHASNGSGAVNGMAFLQALDRIRMIRKELGRTFGVGAVGGGDQQHDPTTQPRRSSSFSVSTMGGSGDNSRLGASSALRMMETLAQKQERAYERLYHWLQKYLHLIQEGGDANFQQQLDEDILDEALSHQFVRQSLATLKNVPAFYSHLLELIASSRRAEETRRFLLALTSGYGGMPPIEMRAHDSVVYIGDMLAFCFRAFSVEADVTNGLLLAATSSSSGEGGDGESEGGKEEGKGADVILEEEEDFLIEKPITAEEMLFQSMGGISRPLKSRILQVISSLSRRPEEGDDDSDDDDDMSDSLEEEGASTRSRVSQLYEICGLLLFYSSAVQKSVKKLHDSSSSSSEDEEGGSSSNNNNNPLLASMMDCLAEATNGYEASLRVYGAMLEQLNLLSGESEASLSYLMVSKIVDVREKSPGFAVDVKCPENYQHTLSMDWACDVLIEASLPSCKTLDDTVSLKQSIAHARKAGLSESKVTSLERHVFERETKLIDVLVEKETTDVLDLCGLGSIVNAYERFKGLEVEGMVMMTHPGLSQEDIEIAMKEFNSSLYSPPLPSLENSIKDPTLRKLARQKISKRVCDHYAVLYEVISTPDKGGYDNPSSMLAHAPEQVNTLFSA